MTENPRIQIMVVLLAVLSAATSLVSAWFWYRSALVETVPLWVELGQIEPVDGSSHLHWTIAQLKAGAEVAGYNRIAALWMVPAALFAGASALAGLFA